MSACHIAISARPQRPDHHTQRDDKASSFYISSATTVYINKDGRPLPAAALLSFHHTLRAPSTSDLLLTFLPTLNLIRSNLHHLHHHNNDNRDTMTDPITLHGWTALPRDPATLLKGKQNPSPKPLTVDDIELPSTHLAKEVLEYAKRELNEQTFNHSMRVFYYGKSSILPPQYPPPPPPEQCARQPFLPFHHPDPCLRGPSPLTVNVHRSRHPTHPLPRVVPLTRNLPPHIPPPRHRHHRPQYPRHPPLLRILRRLPRPRPAEAKQGAHTAVRGGGGGRDTAPGFGGEWEDYDARAVNPVGHDL